MCEHWLFAPFTPFGTKLIPETVPIELPIQRNIPSRKKHKGYIPLWSELRLDTSQPVFISRFTTVGRPKRPCDTLTHHMTDAAHVLPVLFSFTTPAKYCFRAIALFTKYVTGIVPAPSPPPSPPPRPNLFHRTTIRRLRKPRSAGNLQVQPSPTPASEPPILAAATVDQVTTDTNSPPTARPKLLGRSLSARVSRVTSYILPTPSLSSLSIQESPFDGLPNGGARRGDSSTSSDVGGSRFPQLASPQIPNVERRAGDQTTYETPVRHQTL